MIFSLKKKKKKKNTLCTEAAYSKCWQIFIKQEIHSLCNDLYNIKTHFRCKHEGKKEILPCMVFWRL